MASIDFESWELGPFWCVADFDDLEGRVRVRVSRGDRVQVQSSLPGESTVAQAETEAKRLALGLLDKWRAEING